MGPISLLIEQVIGVEAIGGRKDLVEKINAARKNLFGELESVVHLNPQENLAKDLPERVLGTEKRTRELSLKELYEERKSTVNALEKLDERIKKAEAAEKDKIEKKAKRAAAKNKKKLADAEKRAAKANADLADLKAKLTDPSEATGPTGATDSTGATGPTGP